MMKKTNRFSIFEDYSNHQIDRMAKPHRVKQNDPPIVKKTPAEIDAYFALRQKIMDQANISWSHLPRTATSNKVVSFDGINEEPSTESSLVMDVESDDLGAEPTPIRRVGKAPTEEEARQAEAAYQKQYGISGIESFDMGAEPAPVKRVRRAPTEEELKKAEEEYQRQFGASPL